MKKVIIAGVMLVTSMFAMAGTPTYVIDANNAVSYPSEPALSIEKDTTSGNRVKVKYSSGFQYVADNSSWSKYAEFYAALTKPVLAPTSTTGLAYDMAKGFGGCDSQGSWVSWVNVAVPEHVQGDNCAFWTAVKQAPH